MTHQWQCPIGAPRGWQYSRSLLKIKIYFKVQNWVLSALNNDCESKIKELIATFSVRILLESNAYHLDV